MPRSLEMLEHLLRQLERSEICALKAIDSLLDEELSLREGRRVKAALKMGRLLTIKTLAGFDFAFQLSLDRNRILTLAGSCLAGLPREVRDTAWKAQVHLCARYRRLLAVGKRSQVAVSAMAREMVGFAWAIGCMIAPAAAAA